MASFLLDTNHLGAALKPAPPVREELGRRLRLGVHIGTIALALIVAFSAEAKAGMPSINLSDIGAMRLNALSFFAAGFFASAWGIQGIWNLLQRDFPRLPRLTFKAAAGMVFLWGMLFVLVLTMISGARELMTPGAWEKRGLTYKLASADSPASSPAPHEKLFEQRRQQLQALHVALLRYAAKHDGQYPPADQIEQIGSERWNLPDQSGARYLYVPGHTVDQAEAVLAYEPHLFDDGQLVLRSDGRIQSLTVNELQSALEIRNAP